MPWHLRNVAALLARLGYKTIDVYVYRDHHNRGAVRSYWLNMDLGIVDSVDGCLGWERNSSKKLMPKVSDLASLSDPFELANQAVDLNLKLMKWRAAPDIDLDSIKSNKCLLLGAGTLGSYIARGLMAWGVRNITFVDKGTVSYSNPVRQPLFELDDCKIGAPKAEAAAKALRKIFPGVNARGLSLSVPMAGHPVTSEEHQRRDYDTLVEEIKAHDTIFLLMDSRESRWLPTVVCKALGKLVINVAIGFDSFLVMRHGVPTAELGCYFCNDVVAPIDSISRLPLDQMCTVTRPGVAQLASGHAVELFASILQHSRRAGAPADSETALGPVMHQLRGFVAQHTVLQVRGPPFDQCSGCSPVVCDAWSEGSWEFVKTALNDSSFLSELTGLAELQKMTESLEFESDGGLD